MRFITGDPEYPTSLRLVRNLLIVEAAVFALSLTLYGLIGTLNSSSSGTTSTSLSSLGAGAVITRLLGVVAFGGAAYLVGRAVPSGRWLALGLQVVWIAIIVVPTISDSPGGDIIPILLAVATTGLLFKPDVVAAFDAAAAAKAVTAVTLPTTQPPATVVTEPASALDSTAPEDSPAA